MWHKCLQLLINISCLQDAQQKAASLVPVVDQWDRQTDAEPL